ncbi:MAG: sigma 54-interacting transcriptional regulator [Christensenellaceae bacterium]|nr:sigma 54-interacting transcriptional regulator [Christensenellaceae bacterium]
MKDAVYILDTEKRHVYINRAAEKLEGILLKDIKGKTVMETHGLDGLDSPALKALALECPVIDEKYTYYANGKEITQICNAGPIYEDGRLIGVYTIQQDLTPINEMVERNIALQQLLNRKKESEPVAENDPFSGIIGSSEIFSRTVEQARIAAKTDSSVMLIGKTGCGKEVFARAIHNGSGRARKPFLALNCAAIPETLIESILFGTVKGVYTGAVEKEGLLAQADGGTIFLDEINSMPLVSQAKLLRVLEERRIMKLGSNREVPIDIRVISSTNEDPDEAVKNHHIREDLLYRLSVVPVVIPTLRERKEDISELVAYFIQKYNKRFHKHILGVNEDVHSCFMDFHWPGNVRQLKTCIESAMNFAEDGGYFRLRDLPVYIFDDTRDPENRHRRYLLKEEKNIFSDENRRKDYEAFIEAKNRSSQSKNEESFLSSVEDAERRELMEAIRASKGNLAKAARSLGISRQLMYYRVKKYQLK